jgi:hypothetical protein
LGEFRSVLGVLFVSAILAVAFYSGIFFLVGLANEEGALALAKDRTPLPLLYDDDDDDLTQSDFKTNDEGTDGIVPLSSGGYGYSGSSGISVQQNVTQQNVCTSNTAYCYNEVDNDFNVNPP